MDLGGAGGKRKREQKSDLDRQEGESGPKGGSGVARVAPKWRKRPPQGSPPRSGEPLPGARARRGGVGGNTSPPWIVGNKESKIELLRF